MQAFANAAGQIEYLGYSLLLLHRVAVQAIEAGSGMPENSPRQWEAEAPTYPFGDFKLSKLPFRMLGPSLRQSRRRIKT